MTNINSFTSNNQLVTINIPEANCRSMTWTGVSSLTPKIGSSSNQNKLNIYGSLTLDSSVDWQTTSTSGYKVHFLSSSNETITSAGNEFRGDIYFQGTGSYTLQDDLNGRSFYWTNFNHESGTINTNNKDITIYGSYGSSGGSNNTSRTLNLGSSTISGNNFSIYDCKSISKVEIISFPLFTIISFFLSL